MCLGVKFNPTHMKKYNIFYVSSESKVELKRKGCSGIMRIIYGFVLLAIIFVACFGFQSYLIMHLQSQLDNVQHLNDESIKPKVVVLSYTWALSSYDPLESMVSANCTLLNLSPTTAVNVEIDITVSVQNTTITWVRTLADFDPWHTENVYDIVVIYNSSLGVPLNVWLTPRWNGMYGY